MSLTNSPWPASLDLSSRVSVFAVLLSDTHGSIDDRILPLLDRADLAVHGGDIGSPDVLLELARATAAIAVAGNNDTPDQWHVPTLPNEVVVHLPGGALHIEHGHRRNPARSRHAILRRRHAGARAILYGHSHKITIDDGDDPTVLNPGAAGRVRTHVGPSCILLRANAENWAFEQVQWSLACRSS